MHCLDTSLPELARLPGHPLPASFFARSADEVAHDLVGKILWRMGVGGGRLVETEAYLPEGDTACHAARGRTAGNARLFGPPGTLYVYINYGIHHLLNVVCGGEGEGTGVLLRSFEPLGEARLLRCNRGDATGRLPLKALASGPGRLGQALGVDLSLNGLALGEASGVYLLDDGCRPPVERTPRIGISGSAHLPLRYILPGSAFLSRGPRRGQALG